MTVRPVRYLGDPVLRAPAAAVAQVDDAVRHLIDDMIESMYAAQGVGLAAPQIGVGLRVVVFGIPDEEPFVLVNPEIIVREGERRLEGEGCLSVPGYRAPITRAERVVARGLDRDGHEVRIEAVDSLLAQALEHETDHVNGILYVDRIDSPEHLQKLEGTDWVAADESPADARQRRDDDAAEAAADSSAAEPPAAGPGD